MGFDQFIESPSRGASGGILTVWRSDVFKGVLIEVKPFGIIISFTSVHNNEQWFLVNVYGPCQGEARDNFVSWLYNLNIPVDDNWLIIGDFNFIKSSEKQKFSRGRYK